MKALRLVTCAVAILLAAGEIARWWDNPRLFPMALDELLIAGTLFAAAAFSGRSSAAMLVAAWGLFCGLQLALLVPTLDHLLSGPPKDSAGLYAVVLAIMLAIGLSALARSLSHMQEARSSEKASVASDATLPEPGL